MHKNTHKLLMDDENIKEKLNLAIPANPKADKKKLHLLSHSSLSSVSLAVVGSSLIVMCFSKLFLTSSFCLTSSSNSETFLESAKNKEKKVYSHCFYLDLNGLLTRRNFGCIPGMLGTYTIPK